MITVISRDHLIGSVPVGDLQRKGYQASRLVENSTLRRVSGQTSATNAWNQNKKGTIESNGIQYNNNNTKEPFMFIKPAPPQAFWLNALTTIPLPAH